MSRHRTGGERNEDVTRRGEEKKQGVDSILSGCFLTDVVRL